MENKERPLRTAVSIATACLEEYLRRSFAYHDLMGLSYPWTNIEGSGYFWFFRTLSGGPCNQLAPQLEQHEQGIIAEDVAIGNEAILALATGKQEIMREQLQTRLEALRKEFETGQAELEKVERQRISLRETMLRISGAAQVLEEVLLEGQLTRKNGAGTIRTKSDDANGRPADQKLANLPGTAQLQGKFNSSDPVKDG